MILAIEADITRLICDDGRIGYQQSHLVELSLQTIYFVQNIH